MSEGRSGSYAFFDHTADVGIRATGATFEALLTALAQALVALLVEDSVLEPRTSRAVQLTALDETALLIAWLQQVLFWFSTDRFLPCSFAFDTATPTALRGTVTGDRFDPARHVQGREVKAITRHLLEVARRDGQWHAQMIVDI